MNIYKHMEEQTNNLFDFILEFFNRDSETADVAWYFFLSRRIPLGQQSEAYKILSRIAKIKYGKTKRKPPYTGEIYLKAMTALRKILKWLQRTWMRSRHIEINLDSDYVQEQTFKLLNSNIDLAKEYAILFNLIVNWKPFSGVVKKQVI